MPSIIRLRLSTMATRKAVLIIFFFFAALLSYFADSTILNLALIFIWAQVFDTLWNRANDPKFQLSKPRQIFLVKVTLYSLPIVFLIGGLASFTPLFLADHRIAHSVILFLGLLLASLLFVIFAIWPMAFSQSASKQEINVLILRSLQHVRNQFSLIAYTTIVFLILLLSCIWISAETAVVLANSLASLFMARRLGWNRFPTQAHDSTGPL